MTPRAELETLQEQLRQAQNDFELAKFIDHFPDYKRERDAAALRIRALEEKIAEATKRRKEA